MSVKQGPEENFDFSEVKNIKKLKIGIVTSEWNPKVTASLLEACKKTLRKYNIIDENITEKWVPGSFELPLTAQWFFEFKNVDAVVCLGCIIKGETPHFHYISEAVALKIADLSLKYNRPASFGVITAETDEHAIERAGGKKGNKGKEAAMAVLKMLKIKGDLRYKSQGSVGF